MGRAHRGSELKFGSRTLSFCQLAKQLSASPIPAADPLFGAAWAAVGLPRPSRPWNLPLVNGLAVAAIIGGVAYRLWLAHLPDDVLRVEMVLIAAGAVLGVLWVYAVSELMVSLTAVIIWTAVLAGLGILALLTSRTVERDLGIQVERQISLLATLSDLGEGLVITENGRFVAGNDAYVNLTGYTRDALSAMPSLIALAPEHDRDSLTKNLTRRISGGELHARYP